MKFLWDYLQNSNLKRKTKIKVYLIVSIFLTALSGAILWLIIGRMFLSSICWLVCFIGYPAFFIGGLGAIFYLYGHEFA